MKRHLAIVFSVCFITLLFSCQLTDDVKKDYDRFFAGSMEYDDASIAGLIANSCPNHIITSGFGLGWKKLNHRISLWEAYPLFPNCVESLDRGLLKAGYIGGDFSTGHIMTDTPYFEYSGTKVLSRGDAFFISGHVLMLVKGDSFTNSSQVIIQNPHIKPDSQAAIFISGLSIDTDFPQPDPLYPVTYDPALGYTIKGLGARAENISISSGQIKFTIIGRFEPGPADRKEMNLAIEKAVIPMKIFFTVVEPGKGGEITKGSVNYELTYPPPQFPFPQNIEPASDTLRRLEIWGAPGMPLAFPAITGFDFRLFKSVENGDYIRKISVMVKLLEYDSATGKGVLDVNGYASNSSLIAYEVMENGFSASVALVQLEKGAIEPIYLSGYFETGRTEFPLF